MAGSLPCAATGRDDVIWMFILTFVVRFFTFDRIGEGSDRSLANTDILPDANFDALIGQGARQRCGFCFDTKGWSKYGVTTCKREGQLTGKMRPNGNKPSIPGNFLAVYT